MAVPTSMADLSVTAASNSPSGSENLSTADDYLRAVSAILRREQAKAANVASASTVDLGAIADGSYVTITGTTSITSFGTVSAGVERVLVFSGALTLTYNATSLILPGAASITTAAGDVAVMRSDGSGNWKCVHYQKANGSPVSMATPPAIGGTTPSTGTFTVLTVKNGPGTYVAVDSTGSGGSSWRAGDGVGTTNGTFVLYDVTNSRHLFQADSSGNLLSTNGVGSLGYGSGAGGTVTQATSRTTGVTLNKPTGAITMFTAAGSTTAATFTVTNSLVAATDTIILNQKSGTNLYNFIVTAVAAGSFNITFYTTGGTASDAPVINFAIIKGVTA